MIIKLLEWLLIMIVIINLIQIYNKIEMKKKTNSYELIY
jgi:hypothetical protein